MTSITAAVPVPKTTVYSILLMGLVSFIWALMEVLLRFIPANYSIYQVIWGRYAAHILFMLLVFGPRYGAGLVHTRHLKLQIGRALMMLVMPVSFIWATNYMGVKNILAIFWLAPLMIVGLSRLLLHERVRWWGWLTVLAGSAVILLALRPNRDMTLAGILLAFAMTLSFSLYLVMTPMLRHDHRLTNLFYTAVGVLIPLSFGLPFFEHNLALKPNLLIAGVGLLGFLLLFTLDKALEMTPPSILAPFLFAQPVFMIILIYLVKVVTP